MGIFTADKGLAPVLCQEFLDAFYRWVHLAFHITAAVVAAVMEYPFIMHQPGIVQFTETLGHLVNPLPAERLVPAGPDDNRRVVLVPLVTGIDAV